MRSGPGGRRDRSRQDSASATGRGRRTSNNAAASMVLRANGPSTAMRAESTHRWGSTKAPREGLKPTRPQKEAGIRIPARGVRALRQGDQPGRDRGGRAAAGPTGGAPMRPRIARRRRDRRLDDGEDADLAGAELAHDHRARCSDAPGRGVIEGRPAQPAKGPRAHARRHAAHEVQVFDPDGHAKERGAARLAPLPVEAPRRRERGAMGHESEGGERRVLGVDAIEIGSGQLLGGDLRGAERVRIVRPR